MYQTGRDNIIIANVGTGTAFIRAEKDKITHLGGSGVGGGTILGLGKKLLGLSHFADIMQAASGGDLKPVDLLIEDIVTERIGVLGLEATAANFGKMLDTARHEDIAVAIINMVFQVIGMLAVFAAKGNKIPSVIVTGSGSENAIGQRILNEVGVMYDITFEYPEDGQYTTAIGAALS
jgi:type II pantothenate kinase